MKPLIKKYHSKDLNIAYNNGFEQGKSLRTKDILEFLRNYNEKRYGHMKDSCESQEYDAIKELTQKIQALNKQKLNVGAGNI